MSRPLVRRADVGVFKRKLGTNTKKGVPEKAHPLWRAEPVAWATAIPIYFLMLLSSTLKISVAKGGMPRVPASP